MQGRHGLFEIHQRLIVLEHIHVLNLQGVVQLVDLVAALVGVVVAALGAQEFLTGKHKTGTVGGQHHGVCQHGHALDGLLVGNAGGTDAVVQGIVIVAGHIVHCPVGVRNHHTALGRALQAGENLGHIDFAHRLVVSDPALGCCAVQAALDEGVPHLVIELAHALQLVGVDLNGLLSNGQRGSAAGPGLAVNHDVGVDFLHRLGKQIHGFNVVQTHQIEAEAAQLVLLCPEAGGVDDELANHQVFAGHLIAAAGAIGQAAVAVIAEVVAGHQHIKVGTGHGIDMVIHHIHDDVDAGTVKGLHQGLKLPDTGVAILGIGGVDALQHIVVQRIVAPVEDRIGFVVGLVKDGNNLHRIDTQLHNVVKAGGNGDTVSGVGGAALGHAQEGLAPGFIALPGFRRSHIRHMGFPNHQLLAVIADGADFLPAIRIGGIKVHNLTPLAAQARALGVGVHDFHSVGVLVIGNGVGIVLSGVISLQLGREHALLPPGHGHLLQGLVRAVALFIDVQHNAGGNRRPHLEGGFCAGINGTQLAVVIILLIKSVGGIQAHAGNAVSGSGAVGKGDLHLIGVAQHRLGALRQGQFHLHFGSDSLLGQQCAVHVQCSRGNFRIGLHQNLLHGGEGRAGNGRSYREIRILVNG